MSHSDAEPHSALEHGSAAARMPARQNDFALSAPQLGIWFDRKLDPASADYSMAECVEIFGPVDSALFEAALRRVMCEAEALTVRFVDDGAGPRQIVGAADAWSLHCFDMSTASNARAAAEQWIKKDIEQPIDPLHDPMFAYALFKAAPDRFFFCARNDHIVNDGYGWSLVIRRLASVYTSLCLGKAPDPCEFGSLSLLVQEDAAYRASRHFTRDEEYWLKVLANCPEPLSLGGRPSTKCGRFIRQTAYLPVSQASALRDLAKRIGASLPQIATAATAILLHRMTGEEDLVLGFSVSARMTALSQRTPGIVTNVVALRLALGAQMRLSEVISQVAHRLREAFRHQRYRIADLRRALGRFDRPIHGLLVNIMPFDYDLQFAGHRAAAHNLSNGPVDDLSVTIYDRSDVEGLRIDFNANPDRYSMDAVAAHQERFLRLLAALIERDTDERCIGELPLLSAVERQQLLVEWNLPAPSYSKDKGLHQLFQLQVKRRPDAMALTCGRHHLSYGELNARANQLAHFLRRCGVGRDVIVGIWLDRGLDLIIAILGVLKAGGAYLPIDAAYPQERVAFMLEDAGVTVVLTDRNTVANLRAHEGKAICVDDPLLVADQPSSDLDHVTTPDDLAYTIFTSGSTGKPKGALITHYNVVRLFQATSDWFHFNETDVWTLFHSPAFDFSVWEIWGALLYGGRLVIVPHMVSRSPDIFRELLAQEGVTVLNQTPSAFEQLIRAEEAADHLRPLSLRYVIFGGEALQMQSLKPWFDRHGDQRPQLINMYGITETTVHVTYRALTRHQVRSGSVIGIPIPDVQVYILNACLQPAPIGAPGEIYVGGAGLARGYLNRPELTAERFVNNPFSEEPGARLYRTGDLARFLAGREIEYLGRIDNQVKIRGFRIELGEIEAALKRHPAVRDAVVVVREDVPGDRRLVAYVTPPDSRAIDVRDLRSSVRGLLPEYMVPTAFVTLEVLPLTAHGKLDRQSLPAPEQPLHPEDSYVGPRTAVEETLARIWCEVLRLRQVGIFDRFFEIGGDSILALMVSARAREAGLGLAPKEIFQQQTIAGLASVARPVRRHSQDEPLVGPAPLTAVQTWFFEHHFAEPQWWNQMVVLKINDNLDPSLLEQALRALVTYHDALRLRFRFDGTCWSQFDQGSNEALTLGRFDLGAHSEGEQDCALRDETAALHHKLDLVDGPLMAAAWFDLGARRPSRLVVVIHHLVVDGVSWRILLEDLELAVQQLRQGATIRLPAKTTSFTEWARRVKAYACSTSLLQAAEYWLAPSLTDCQRIPRDLSGGDNLEGSTRVVSVALGAAETRELLQDVRRAYNTEVNDVLVAALATTVARWMGACELRIDMEGHGREDLWEAADLSRTVGWFTSIFPVKLRLGENRGPGEVLKAIKEQLRAIPQRGLTYGLVRYLSDDEHASGLLRTAPQSELVFNYLGQIGLTSRLDAVFSLSHVGSARSPRARRTHLLAIDALVIDEQLRVDWSYSENAHRYSTILQLAEDFLDQLRDFIRHCKSVDTRGYTPSDFALSGLSQAELDRLIAELD